MSTSGDTEVVTVHNRSVDESAATAQNDQAADEGKSAVADTDGEVVASSSDTQPAVSGSAGASTDPVSSFGQGAPGGLGGGAMMGGVPSGGGGPASGNSGGEGQAIKLFIGQVPRTMPDSEVRSMFEQYGPIADFTLLRDKATGQPKGETENRNHQMFVACLCMLSRISKKSSRFSSLDTIYFGVTMRQAALRGIRLYCMFCHELSHLVLGSTDGLHIQWRGVAAVQFRCRLLQTIGITQLNEFSMFFSRSTPSPGNLPNSSIQHIG